MKKFLALVLALVMTMSLVTIGASAADDGFKDADKINNTEAVEVLAAIGVIGGYGDGTFRPQATLTRGAGAKFIAYLVLGQEKADKLAATYTVFSDVDDSVGLAAYIEWAAAAGIVQGYGDGRFGPYDTLTQYAFGKMLLAALGYDATEEGYVGAGWQKNVYTDAFAAGIYDGTESYTSCDRETAARFALGALKAEVVVYGKLSNIWVSKTLGDAIIDSGNGNTNGNTNGSTNYGELALKLLNHVGFSSVEGAIGTGYALWENYKDLDYYDDDERDIFGRPGHAWTYGDDFSKFYMDEAVAEYTTEVSVCDVLVDMGYAKTSKDSANVDYWVDGAVFVHKNAVEYNHFESLTIGSNTKTCADKLGGQGTLTQVFEVGDDQYVVTEIHTYLARVDSVKDTTHKKDGETGMTVWYAGASAKSKAQDSKLEDVKVSDNIGYDKDDAVLVNIGNAEPGFWEVADQYSATSDAAKELAEAQAGSDGKVALVVVGEPSVIESAKYDGVYTNKSQAHVAGEWKNVAYMYSASVTKLTKEQAEKKESFDFYVDQYGNLIGDAKPDSAVNYGVIQNVKWVNNTDDFDNEYALFQIVGADATVSKLHVDEYNGTELVNAAHGSAASLNGTNPTVSSEQADNGVYYAEGQFYGVVKSYSEDNVVAVTAEDGAEKKTGVTFTTGDGNVTGMDAKVNNNTVFLVKTTVDNKPVYTSYIGIDDLKTIKLATAVAVTEEGDTYASFVYIDATNAIFAGSSVIALVLDTEDEYFLSGDKYGYTVYINGEKATNIAVDKKDFDDKDSDLFSGAGIYELEYNNAGKLIKATRQSTNEGYVYSNDIGDVEGGQVVIGDRAYNVANTVVYKLTYAEGETVGSANTWSCISAVSVGTLEDIDDATFVVYKANKDDANVLDYVWAWVEE